MNTIREVQKINQLELDRGIAGTSASWHAQYAHSAWVYVGNLDHAMTEGDVVCVLSQFGEIEDIHLVRDEATGKSRGFAFAKYEDARSCVLAVDNFCGVLVCGRSMRVDHVENYRLPKHILEKEEDNTNLIQPGLAYKDQELVNDYNLERGPDLFAPPPQKAAVKEPVATRIDTVSSSSLASSNKEAKRKRKEDRQRIREEREQRRKEKEKKRADRERKHGSRRRDHEHSSHSRDGDSNTDHRVRKKRRSRGDSIDASPSDRSR
jgi:RNA-binding motif protein, X-linked 2